MSVQLDLQSASASPHEQHQLRETTDRQIKELQRVIDQLAFRLACVEAYLQHQFGVVPSTVEGQKQIAPNAARTETGMGIIRTGSNFE